MSSLSNRKKVMKGNRWRLKLLTIQRVFNCMSSIQSPPDACACRFSSPNYSVSSVVQLDVVSLQVPKRGDRYPYQKQCNYWSSLQGERRCVGRETDLCTQSVVDLGSNMLATLGRVLLVMSVSAETFWGWIRDLGSSRCIEGWLRDPWTKFSSDLRS